MPHPRPQIQHPSPICCDAWCQSQHRWILSHPAGSEHFPVALGPPRVSVGRAVSAVSMGACRLPSRPVECLPPPSSRWYDNGDTGDPGRGASRDGASGPCGEGPGRASPTHQGVPTGCQNLLRRARTPAPTPAREFIDTLRKQAGERERNPSGAKDVGRQG